MPSIYAIQMALMDPIQRQTTLTFFHLHGRTDFESSAPEKEGAIWPDIPAIDEFDLPPEKPFDASRPAPQLAHADPQPDPAELQPPMPPRKPESLANSIMLPMGQITFDKPTLAPFAHVRFCLMYPEECRVAQNRTDDARVDLTPERHAELVRVNASVNAEIHPRRATGPVVSEEWLIGPKYGDCNDYAVTKRHRLIKLGWPPSALLLAEVIVPWGEHHLVLVVRTSEGDLVADSLEKRIRGWVATSYRWVRVQSSVNPKFWSTVDPSEAARVASTDNKSRL